MYVFVYMFQIYTYIHIYVYNWTDLFTSAEIETYRTYVSAWNMLIFKFAIQYCYK